MTGRIDEITGRGDSGAKSGDGSAPPRDGVGALLRASRIRCGEDLAQVADALRIRLAFLEAIEDGRFGDLPGPTYTLGFVRTYANHLGLDVEEVIRRLRVETEIQTVKPDLSFPVPVSDTTMPTGAVVMIGVVAAAVAYGAYLMSSFDDRVDVARISPVPERMAANPGLASAQSADAPAAGSTQGEAPPPSAPVESTPAPVSAASAAASAPPPSDPAPSAPVLPAPPPPAPVVSTPAPASTPDAAPQVAALPHPAPAPATETPRPPRIEVRAKADSWIQVREGTAGAMLFTRLLRVGETYAVPARSGLMLLTGNAGALEILVDGAAVPALGPDGAVRRSIALDAERLKAGTAAVE